MANFDEVKFHLLHFFYSFPLHLGPFKLAQAQTKQITQSKKGSSNKYGRVETIRCILTLKIGLYILFKLTFLVYFNS